MSDTQSSFKQRRTVVQRKEEVQRLRQLFPKKIPVIVDRYTKEKVLPALDKNRFLLPEDLTVAQFLSIIRNRLSVSTSQTFYLIVNKRTMVSMSETLGSLYASEQDEDGFLYVIYASQDAFGKSYSRFTPLFEC